jgi:hypothetical protein
MIIKHDSKKLKKQKSEKLDIMKMTEKRRIEICADDNPR